MTEEELEKFKQKINETTTFPSVYMYKFIVESENRKIALVESLFDENADIHTKESEDAITANTTSRLPSMVVCVR